MKKPTFIPPTVKGLTRVRETVIPKHSSYLGVSVAQSYLTCPRYYYHHPLTRDDQYIPLDS